MILNKKIVSNSSLAEGVLKKVYCITLNIKDIDNFDIRIFKTTIPHQLRVYNKKLDKSYHCFDTFSRNVCGKTLEDVKNQIRIDCRNGVIDDLL